MQNSKVLFLLLSFVIFINYINYILPNRDKQQREIELLERKIAKEHKLNHQKIDPKKLLLPYDEYFFDGKKYNYSQAMGKFQEIITKSAKGNCKVAHVKWAPTPSTKSWYDTLKIDTLLECYPKDVFVFINKLRDNSKLFYPQNLTAYPLKKIQKVRVNMQLVAYRKHNEK